jgi:hypothetical protein
MLFYPGFEVLPPLVFYRTEKTDEQRFAQQCRELGQRLDTLANRAHSLPPAESRRLSDPVPDAAPGAGAWRKRACAASDDESNAFPVIAEIRRYHRNSYDEL